MNEYEQKYEQVGSFLRVARGFMTDLAVLFEEDENGHDMSSVEDLRQELDDLILAWKELPENLIGGDIK